MIRADIDTNVLVSGLISSHSPPAQIVDLWLATAGMLQLPGVTRDIKDDPLVACAVEGHAEFLVSGDKDILDLITYDSVRMVTPAEFLIILEI